MPSKITQILTYLLQQYPQPRIELHFNTPFEFFIAALLSPRVTDKQVNKVTAQLFKVANTPQSICALGKERLVPYLNSLQYYQVKTGYVLQSCALIVTQFGGQIPTTRAQLESLPGVGRKVASVVLNTLFKIPAVAVDTHVLRVSNRLGLARSTKVKEIEKQLLASIDDQYHLELSNLLVLHGRYVCKAVKPLCSSCGLNKICPTFNPELQ